MGVFILNDNQEMEVLKIALDAYGVHSLDFVDCVL